jgi:hypothetical protein
MKRKVYLLLAVLTVGVAATWYSCETDPEETCLQDEFCDIPVTACCDDNDVCVFKYNGKEYPDTDEGMAQLLEDLDCVATIEKLESVEQKSANAEIVDRLKNLMSRVRELTLSSN